VRPRQPVGHRWSAFIQNHANAIVTCDTSVTATFRVLYVFIAIEIGSRRIPAFLGGKSGHR
jgi:hypothetical protein